MIASCITCKNSSGVVSFVQKKHNGQFIVNRLIDISADGGGKFQDRLYGPGVRVHTLGPKKQSGERKKTCTVCGRSS